MAPATSPTPDDIKRVFKKIVETQTSTGIHKQKELSKDWGGVCYFLSERTARELSDQGFIPIKVSLIYPPGHFWDYHMATGVVDSKQNIWMCDVWHSLEYIQSFSDWVRTHFQKSCVLDIFSPHQFLPLHRDTQVPFKDSKDCSDYIRSEQTFRTRWESLGDKWQTSHPVHKSYYLFSIELEKQLGKNLPKTLPLAIIARYLGIEKFFSSPLLSSEASLNCHHLYFRALKDIADWHIQSLILGMKNPNVDTYGPAITATLYLVKKFPTLIPRVLKDELTLGDKSLLDELIPQSKKNPSNKELLSLIGILT